MHTRASAHTAEQGRGLDGQGGWEDSERGREAGSDGEGERMTVHHFYYGGTVRGV